MRDSPPDWAAPGAPRSYTVTAAPRRDSSYAVASPTIPAPTTATQVSLPVEQKSLDLVAIPDI